MVLKIKIIVFKIDPTNVVTSSISSLVFTNLIDNNVYFYLCSQFLH